MKDTFSAGPIRYSTNAKAWFGALKGAATAKPTHNIYNCFMHLNTGNVLRKVAGFV